MAMSRSVFVPCYMIDICHVRVLLRLVISADPSVLSTHIHWQLGSSLPTGISRLLPLTSSALLCSCSVHTPFTLRNFSPVNKIECFLGIHTCKFTAHHLIQLERTRATVASGTTACQLRVARTSEFTGSEKALGTSCLILSSARKP